MVSCKRKLLQGHFQSHFNCFLPHVDGYSQIISYETHLQITTTKLELWQLIAGKMLLQYQ